MREEMEIILKQELQNLIFEQMRDYDCTQAQMADMLYMATRSFADIEKGKNMCGTLTAILLLMQLPSADPFLSELKHKFDLLQKY